MLNGTDSSTKSVVILAQNMVISTKNMFHEKN